MEFEGIISDDDVKEEVGRIVMQLLTPSNRVTLHDIITSMHVLTKSVDDPSLQRKYLQLIAILAKKMH